MTGALAIQLDLRNQEAEESYQEDQKEKRLLARAGKTHRPCGGLMRTPVDFLSPSARQEYIRPSEVRVYQMSKQVPMWEEFTVLPTEEQIRLLEEWRENQSVDAIVAAMGVSKSRYYYHLRHKLGYQNGLSARAADDTPPSPPSPLPPPPPEPEPSPLAKESGMVLSLRGAYAGKQLEQRLMVLASSLGGVDTAFEVSLTLKEVAH